VKEIVLATINAKWIHPSLALRLLKANLGSLEEKCEIIELNLRQPLRQKVEVLLHANPRILGLSVSIWNHLATIELLVELEKAWIDSPRPIVVLGGPEVTHLPPDAEIFKFADFVIRGEGEAAFHSLCEYIFETGAQRFGGNKDHSRPARISDIMLNDVSKIKSAYHFYTDEDIAKKLIYVESSRGCPFNCEFCSSAADKEVREFPLEPFLAQMDALVKRGARTFKFLDRSFNVNIKRALKIIEFFLEKIEEKRADATSLTVQHIWTVHFEMVPSLFPDELREALTRFPPGSLRLEIGIQSLNREVCARIGRPSDPEKELETLRFLREKTNAVIHADLIAGLPGEDLASFARGFDRLWLALSPKISSVHKDRALSPKTSSVPKDRALSLKTSSVPKDRALSLKTSSVPQDRALSPKTSSVPEIQLGILKLLPGAPISRHNEEFGMRYNPLPPYEIVESAAISAADLRRIKNFARFWELIVGRGLAPGTTFDSFMALSDSLFAHFGRDWGIGRDELFEFLGPNGNR